MLERMRRETTSQYIKELIAKIRAGIPGIAIRTTFIVGFPGETEACFQALLDFIKETRFERMGVFTYSRQDGTRAGNMEAQIPDAIKKRRQKLAMSEQLKIARAISKSFVGQEMEVLVEREAHWRDLPKDNIRSWEHGLIRSTAAYTVNPKTARRGAYLIARAQADAPDIDGRVYIRGKLKVGEFARVKITAHTDYDLLAEPV